MKPEKPRGRKGKKKSPPKPQKAAHVASETQNSAAAELGAVIVLMLRESNHDCAKACHAALAKLKWQSTITQTLIKVAKRRMDETALLRYDWRAALRQTQAERDGERDRNPKEDEKERRRESRDRTFKLRWIMALIPRYGDPKIPHDPKGVGFMRAGNYDDPKRRIFFVRVLADSDDWTPVLDEIRGYAERRDEDFFSSLGKALYEGRKALFEPDEIFMLRCWDYGIVDDLDYDGIREGVKTNGGIEGLYNTPPLKSWGDQPAADLLNFLFPNLNGDMDPKRYQNQRTRLQLKRGKASEIRAFEARQSGKNGRYHFTFRTK